MTKLTNAGKDTDLVMNCENIKYTSIQQSGETVLTRVQEITNMNKY